MTYIMPGEAAQLTKRKISLPGESIQERAASYLQARLSAKIVSIAARCTMSNKTILECPTCGQRLNAPTDRGELELTCPKCRTNWRWGPKFSRALPRFEVRPNTRRNAALTAAGCAIFSIGGLAVIFSGEIKLGLITLLFFGGGGIYAIPKLLKRKVSMVLSANGIELFYPQGSAFIAWADVEEIGIVRILSTKLVGIRLRSYDRYLKDMSPGLAAFLVKSLPLMKLITKQVLSLEAPGGVGLWLEAEGKSLKSFGDVGNLAQALMWARENYGYDLTFAWSELDRPPDKFVSLLEEYRCSV